MASEKNVQDHIWNILKGDSPIELKRGDLIKTRKGSILRVSYKSIGGWVVYPLDKDIAGFNIPNELIALYPKIGRLRAWLINRLRR